MTWSWRTLKQFSVPDDSTSDKFWSAVSVWNTKPHLLIKHLMGAERLLSNSLTDNWNKVFSLLVDQSTSWLKNPFKTFQTLDLSCGGDVQVEVWKLLTKKPADWNDYLRLSVFGKNINLNEPTVKFYISFNF